MQIRSENRLNRKRKAEGIYYIFQNAIGSQMSDSMAYSIHDASKKNESSLHFVTSFNRITNLECFSHNFHITFFFIQATTGKRRYGYPLLNKVYFSIARLIFPVEQYDFMYKYMTRFSFHVNIR